MTVKDNGLKGEFFELKRQVADPEPLLGEERTQVDLNIASDEDMFREFLGNCLAFAS